jgi:hypothetical protein
MPSIRLSWGSSSKTDGAPIRARSRLSINWRRDGENACGGKVKTSTLVIHISRGVAQRIQYGIIKRFRSGNIIGADHNMTEHNLSQELGFVGHDAR